MNKPLDGWPYQPDKCPCDDQFIEYLNRLQGHNIVFHMGTGLHHKVGLYCASRSMACLGMTASIDEVFAYYEQAWCPTYQIIFGNIYKLDVRTIPYPSIISLFHMGELVDMFGDIDEEAIKRLLKRSVPKGLAFFYQKSSAWDRAIKTVEKFEESKLLEPVDVYKDLLVCTINP